MKQLITVPFETVWKYAYFPTVLRNYFGIKDTSQINDPHNTRIQSLINSINRMKTQIIQNNWIQPIAVYDFFKAKPDGDYICLVNSEEQLFVPFPFTRNATTHKSYADLVHPQNDQVACFVATCGTGIAPLAQEMIQKGEYTNAHILSSLALASVEGLAEYCHQHIRSEWGFPDPEGITLSELIHKKYPGIRISFGYPYCPPLSEHSKLWKLLSPDKTIGVTLTSNGMMNPEASVSAWVFQNRNADYLG